MYTQLIVKGWFMSFPVSDQEKRQEKVFGKEAAKLGKGVPIPSPAPAPVEVVAAWCISNITPCLLCRRCASLGKNKTSSFFLSLY